MQLVKTYKHKRKVHILSEFDRLIFEVSTKTTVVKREQVVIDNLKRKGLI